MSAYVPPQRPPAPGQGYYNGYSEARRRAKPPRSRRESEREYSPRGTEYRPYDYAQSDRGYSRAPPAGSEHSGYAPTQRPRGDSLYAMAPYDEEKAYAEWNRAYGPEAQAPPQSEYGSRAPPPPSNTRSRVRYADERSDDLITYDARGRPYDDISLTTDTTYIDHRRRRNSRPPPPPLSPRSPPPNEDKDRGVSALIGGASGAYLGSRLLRKGALGTLGGAIAGAIGVNVIEHFDGKRKEQKEMRNRRRRGDDLYDDDRRYFSDEGYGRPRVDSVYGSVPPPRRRYDDRPYSRRRRSRYRRRSPPSDSYASEY